jgi:hypothetical protein
VLKDPSIRPSGNPRWQRMIRPSALSDVAVKIIGWW